MHEQTLQRFQVKVSNELGLEAWHRHIHGSDKDHQLSVIKDDEGVFVICGPCGESIVSARCGTHDAKLHEDAPAVPLGLKAKYGVEYGCGSASCTDCYEEVELPEPGAPTMHDLPDGGRMEMMHEGVYIYDASGQEVVCWVDDEWEDPSTVTATLNAISLALKHGAEAVRRRIPVPGAV